MTAKEQAGIVRWTALVLGTAVLLFAAYVLIVPRDGMNRFVAEDIHNVRQMVGGMLSAPSIRAAADGRIDVYRTVFGNLELVEDNALVVRNFRADRGPTIAEIRAGDYRNFAWERAVADEVRHAVEKVPLLWDPEPIDGRRIVGFSNGLVKLMSEKEFQAIRR